ncbi:fimbrial protein [Erwinia sp. SLM-02]|uniref:fimbrial protein n=1 Tax=Erwinia sp. SLM-02 TaxID=3020057 RepID=UPI00308096FA
MMNRPARHKIFRRAVRYGLLSTLLMSFSALAYDEGEITPEIPGGFKYNVAISEMDLSSSEVGTEVRRNWDMGGRYTVDIHCSQPMNDLPRYYTATTTMMPSLTSGYLSLNEYIDVKVEVFMISGNNSQGDFVTVPFTGRPNNVSESCVPPSSHVIRDTKSGSEGRLSFVIKKQLINGLNLEGTELVRLYGRLGYAPVTLFPLATITITSGIITVPDKCIVNQGEPIVIPFDDIPGSGVDANNTKYRKDVPIRVKCEGGSFSTGNLNIKMGIQPAGSGLASFNPDYLGTTGAGLDRSNLGVALWDKSGTPVLPNHFYNIDQFDNNQGKWNLTASPVIKKGAEVPEGDYESNASVVAEFQ